MKTAFGILKLNVVFLKVLYQFKLLTYCQRHARSEKLLNGGRLKATLNSDGEIDNEDTPAKQDAKIAAKSQVWLVIDAF